MSTIIQNPMPTQTHYYRFPDRDTALTLAAEAGYIVNGETWQDSLNHSIFVIGDMYETIDAETSVKLDGYHVNIWSKYPETIPVTLQPYEIYPVTPSYSFGSTR